MSVLLKLNNFQDGIRKISCLVANGPDAKETSRLPESADRS